MTRKQLPGLNGIPCGEGKAEDVKSTRWGVQNLAHPGHHQHHKSWDTGWTDFVDQSIGSRVYRGKFFPIPCVRLPNSAAHRGKFSTKLLDVLLCLCLWCLLLLPESLTFRHLSRTLSTVSQKPPVPDWLTSARPLCFSLHDLLLFRWSLLLLLSNVKSHSSCASQESGCLFCLCFFLILWQATCGRLSYAGRSSCKGKLAALTASADMTTDDSLAASSSLKQKHKYTHTIIWHLFVLWFFCFEYTSRNHRHCVDTKPR